jgi:ankyrin repeat protein
LACPFNDVKHLLFTTIAALVLVGCGNPEADLALLNANREGNIEAAKQAIDDGADVNAKDEFGWTPLHYATANGHKEVTELLIAKGADVNVKDGDGETPLDQAEGETADLLRKHGGKSGAEDSIYVAARVGNIEAVKQHLAAGADVNAMNRGGVTPLLMAADKGHKEIAELLISKGADVRRGYVTPLHRAAYHGHKEIVELLIVAGADVNVKGSDGTPLDWANRYNHPATAALLLKHGGKTGEELKAAGN